MATNTNSHHHKLPPRAPMPQPLQTSLSPLPPLPPLPLWPPWPPLPPVSPHRPATRGAGDPASSPCGSPRPGRCQTAAGGAGWLQGPGQTQPGAVSQDALSSPRLLASLSREKQARVRRGIKAWHDRDQERALLLASLLPQFHLQENTPEIQVCVTEKQGGGGNHGEVRRDPTATVTVPRSELKTGRARSTDVGTGCAAPQQRSRLAGRAGAPCLHPRPNTHTQRRPCPLQTQRGAALPCSPHPKEQLPLSTSLPPMLTAPSSHPAHTPCNTHSPQPCAPPQRAQHTQPPVQLRREWEQRPRGWDLPIPVG